jgi:hypothetical protein
MGKVLPDTDVLTTTKTEPSPLNINFYPFIVMQSGAIF